MLALVKTKLVNEFQIESREIPILDSNEVLIKVEYCGVCGSDLHAANHAKGYEFVPKPIILGHEFSGSIVDAHIDLKNRNLIGKRVVVEPGVYCNECENCLAGRNNICSSLQCMGLHFDGGMVQFVKVNINSIIEIPDALPFELAALAEPLSVASHAVRDRGKVKNGQNVLVQGCGIIGFFTALSAKIQGANVTITGLEKDWEARLSHAANFGIQTEIVGKTSNEMKNFDVIFECSGSPIAAKTGLLRLKKGGDFILIALFEQDVPLPINFIVRSEINVVSSYAYTRENFRQALEILNNYDEKLKNIISIYPLEKGATAFSDARQQKILKPIIKVQ